MWGAPSGSGDLRSPRLRAKRPLDYELLAGGVSDSDLTDILKKRITDIQALRDQDAREITFLESGSDYFDFFNIKVTPSVTTSTVPIPPPPPVTPTPVQHVSLQPPPPTPTASVQIPVPPPASSVPTLSETELREKQAAEGMNRDLMRIRI